MSIKMRGSSRVFVGSLLIFRYNMKKREDGMSCMSEERMDQSASMELLVPWSHEELEEVKNLFLQYEKSIGINLCFQGFQEEMATLPGKYQEPQGVLILLNIKGEAAGCCALRPLDDRICELKRLYVKEEHRRRGLSKILMERILKEAKEKGYERIRLDTLETMKPAIQLYRSYGFQEISPYIYNPLPEALYFEKIL